MKKQLLAPLFMPVALLTAVNCCANESEWRSVDPENAVVMMLPTGKAVIELAPQFSPQHAKRFKNLVKQGFYDGEKFYRVIEGFVAQAGPQDGSDKDKSIKPLAIEEDFVTDASWSFTLVQENDLFAPQTGFKDGFALGYSPKEFAAKSLS